ncbi:MAG TPA: hypothetical protein PLZ51_13820, partial [Aggregatilineales bacterium]|nr:hypothetical protein [Aggregatilineales bacterium]
VCGAVVSLEPFYGTKLAPAPLGISPVIAHTVVLSAILIVYTAIDAMFTAALGVGASVSTYNASMVSGAVFMARFIAIFGFIVWIWTIYQNFRVGWGY